MNTKHQNNHIKIPNFKQPSSPIVSVSSFTKKPKNSSLSPLRDNKPKSSNSKTDLTRSLGSNTREKSPKSYKSSFNQLEYLNQIPMTSTKRTSFPLNKSDRSINSSTILSSILDSNAKYSPNNPSEHKQCLKEIENIKSNRDQRRNLKFIGNNIDKHCVSSVDTLLSIIEKTKINFIRETFENQLAIWFEYLLDSNERCRLGAIISIYYIIKKSSGELDENNKQNILQEIINWLQNNYEMWEEVYLVSCLNIFTLFGSGYEIWVDNMSLISMFLTDFNYPLLQRAAFVCWLSLGKPGWETWIKLASKEYQEYQQYILQSLINTPHIQRLLIVRALVNELSSHDIQRVEMSLAALNRWYNIVDNVDVLNRLQSILWEEKNKTRFKRRYIINILRTSGQVGESMLLNLWDKVNDQDIKEEICKVFGYRWKQKPNYLQIVLDKNDTYSAIKDLPGRFCTYYGELTPVINYTLEERTVLDDNEENEDNSNNSNNGNNNNQVNNKWIPNINNSKADDYLEVNTRDLLTVLKRMMTFNYDHTNPEITHNSGKVNLLDTVNWLGIPSEFIKVYHKLFIDVQPPISNEGNTQEMSPQNNNENDDEIINFGESTCNNFMQTIGEDNGRIPISENIIHLLIMKLTDISPKVKIVAAISLGKISSPEGWASVNPLLYNWQREKDINVKSALLWAWGRMAEGIPLEAYPWIVSFVNDNMWKVKRAAFYTISQIGEPCADAAVQILSKALKDSPINKQIIAETLIHLGNSGEVELLNLMNFEPDTKYKLKASITRSFAFSNINSRNIDFILECLFKQSSSEFPIIRKNSLFAIHELCSKSTLQTTQLPYLSNNNLLNTQTSITYLGSKNILPFYYEKLKDKEKSIQLYSIFCIQSFGPQGEWIFIEGWMKDSNPTVRANCGIGLGEMGVHTIRTIINHGLYDSNDYVRTCCMNQITEKMKPREVFEYFKANNQLISWKFTVDEVLSSLDDYKLSERFKAFCQAVNELIRNEDKNLYSIEWDENNAEMNF